MNTSRRTAAEAEAAAETFELTYRRKLEAQRAEAIRICDHFWTEGSSEQWAVACLIGRALGYVNIPSTSLPAATATNRSAAAPSPLPSDEPPVQAQISCGICGNWCDCDCCVPRTAPTEEQWREAQLLAGVNVRPTPWKPFRAGQLETIKPVEDRVECKVCRVGVVIDGKPCENCGGAGEVGPK